MRRESDPRTIRVLLVEDDEDDYLLTRECLLELGPRRIDLQWVSTCERALEELDSGVHDVCLLDYQLGATTGLELLRRAQGRGCRGPFILLTGQADDAVDQEAEQAGVADYLEKSKLTATLLHRSIRYALQHARTLEQLRRSQESFRDLIEHLPDGVCVMQDERLVYANSAFTKMVEVSSAQELLGRTIPDVGEGLVVGEDWAGALADIAFTRSTGRASAPREIVLHRARGGPLHVEILHLPLLFDGHPSRVWLLRDLTERKQMEARLLRADRMGALGLLSAGVAHEINNPLAYMMANLDHLERQVLPRLAPSEASTEATELLNEARTGATRVRDIVRQLKMFSRGDEDTALGPVDVHGVLETSIGMAVNELKHRARLVRDYGPALRVEANEGRLSQVILNLLVNAAQAITEGHAEDNEVRIVTRPEGALVRIEVRDTGSGISPEDLKRVFEPFFTTKPVGVGTGLGLSICHDLVTGFGGRMGVESQRGRGSTFWLLLKQSAAARAPEAPATVAARPPSRRGRILVVDDEPLIGTAIRRMLQREHEVVTLTSAREALTRLLGGERFDVIFCDVMMPEMSGVEFHQQLQLHLPQRAARLVFLTGGAFTPQTQEALGKVDNRRLDKPFSGQELHDAVQALLAKSAAS